MFRMTSNNKKETIEKIFT